MYSWFAALKHHVTDLLCVNVDPHFVFALSFLCHRDPFRAHRDHMRHMMRSFSEPYGAPLMPSIMDGRSRGRDMAQHPSSSLALRDEHRVRMSKKHSVYYTYLT